MNKLYEMLVRALMLSPYGVNFNKERWSNVRSAKNTIQLCSDIGIEPRMLFDVGANNSQWSFWIKKRWPTLRVVSFEPHPSFKPIGEVHRVALSDKNGEAMMTTEHGSSHISGSGTVPVKMVRFDSLPIRIENPSILKVDCENFTYSALAGFGERLKEFDLIVVEMWNYYPHLPQFLNQQTDIWELMLSHGKNCTRLVDVEWTSKDGFPVYDLVFYSGRNAPDQRPGKQPKT